MANGALDVVVRFVGDSSSLQKEAGKVDQIGGKLGGFAKGAGVALAGAFSVATVADWVGQAEDAEATSAKLAKTLSNAGDASGAWAKNAEDLAGTLSKQTGIDDDVIKGGQTVLATFHSAVPVMDRATKAAVDLSATGFGSVESASTMLGKALEDPEKGITALGKAGVTFTDVQKDQIKGFMAAGDAASAQAVILANVESQVGGVAEASATSGAKMSLAFGEVTESIGTALLPVLDTLAPILASVAGFIEENTTWLVPLAAAIGVVVIAQWAWNAAMLASPLGLVIAGIAALIAIIMLVVIHWDTIKAAAMAVWQWIVDHWPLLLTILLGPIGLAVAQIVQHWDTIRDGIAAVFNWIVDHWQLLLGILLGPIAGAVAIIVTHWDTIKNTLSGAIDTMKGLWDAFVGFITGIAAQIVGAFTGIPGQLYSVGADMMNSLKDGIVSAATSVIDKVRDIGGSIVDAVNPLGSPHRVSYYAGQEMMRQYSQGIESQQRSLGRTMAGIGAGTFGSSSRSGGTRITVNVTAPVGSNPAEIGRTVADYLDAFYRRNGNRTRAVA